MDNITIYLDLKDYLLSLKFTQKDNIYTKCLGFGKLYVINNYFNFTFGFYSYDEEPFSCRETVSINTFLNMIDIKIIVDTALNNLVRMYSEFKIYKQ